MGYLLVLLGIINKCVQDIVPDPQEVCIVTSTYSAPVILLCPEDNYLSCIAHHALLHSLVSPALPCNVPCLSSPLSPVSPWSTRKNPLHCPPSTLALSLYPRSSRGWGEGIYLPKGKFIFTGDLWSLIVSSFLKITSKMRSYKLGTEACLGRREGTELEALSSLICISHSPPPNRAAVCLLPAGWLRQPRNHKALAPHRLIASPGYQMDWFP